MCSSEDFIQAAIGDLCAIAGLSAEELPRNEHAMDADAPAHVQYGCESLTITGETNQAQGESRMSNQCI